MSYSKRLYEQKHYGKSRTGVPFFEHKSPQNIDGSRGKTLPKSPGPWSKVRETCSYVPWFTDP